ncbi:hypothetical protein BJF87_18630 [Gordonia sp. CNJ-863]|uniref:Rv1733c family protein n=1 Tax=Gordonia TaxID=2053 RepID=UPI00095B86D3|nr:MULTISPECIES: hypothetical protein [Gordonia]MDH3026935.1 hypothetical protein [Gordonia alkanivorans]MDH3047887.1 hypothetical protein [Gordonia alkanivorans]MDJ0008516.1 hypothetical protein [Gordonia alkanivorans]MDJ0098534.1 hypothetical protein [Gordonia alkanivorans]MDJ0494091.1 hypothetical protein [Gordonia alkanivorans]
MLRFLARELHSWRMMHASSNRLVRPLDRLETTVLLALCVSALAGLLAALTVGGNTYAAHKAAAEVQGPRHSVSATVITTPKQDDSPTIVAWRRPDGARLTAAVDSERQDRVGRVRLIWLDDEQRVADPPVTHTDAVVEGVMAGLGVVMLTAMGWWGLVLLVRAAADRHRMRRWEAEWLELDIDSHR